MKERAKLAERCSRLNLIGVYKMPDGSWVVSDGRCPDNNDKFDCPSKGAVLSKIAQLLEEMQPPARFDEDTSEIEMTFIITTQVSLCDNKELAEDDIRASVCDALQHAVKYGEQNGFVHNLAEDISIGVVSVDTLCVD